jgi:hypothetical protein
MTDQFSMIGLTLDRVELPDVAEILQAAENGECLICRAEA